MRRLFALAATGLLALGAANLPAARAAEDPIDVLLFTATYSHRHESIPQARTKFEALEQSGEFRVDATDDPGRIDAAGLADYDVLVLLNSGGDYPFSDLQKRELMEWRADGGGLVGIHTPVDGNSGWPEYGRMLGAVFFHHAHTGAAENVVENRDNPLVAHLPPTFDLDEEYYRWQFDPRDNVRVLTSLNRSSIDYSWGDLFYEEAQPLTWCHEYGGRTFYSAYGHGAETYAHPGVWEMFVQALRWTGGRLDGVDCSPEVPASADRLQAEDANDITRGRKEHSTHKGAELVVTDLLHEGHLRFRDVDLTGVRSLRFLVSVESSPQQFSWRPTVPRPAAGGTIHVRADKVRSDDPNASCDFAGPCAPAVDLASVEVAPAAPGWNEVTVAIPPTPGTHDLIIAFSNELSSGLNSARLFAPDVVDTTPLFTIDWIELER